MQKSNNELLDIVDHNDKVIGQKLRSDIYNEKISNFRVINAFLINNNKQVWIPRRSPKKKLFPLCLDASVGGHVTAGETYEQAFERELKEELNIELSDISYQMMAKLTPPNHGVSAYMNVYLIITNEEPLYNSNDFISASWYEISQLQSIIKNGEPTKGDLPILIDLLFDFLS